MGTSLDKMTSILREQSNISKKQLEFMELLNADAVADAKLKESQLSDPTMGNSNWYPGVLSSEQSRRFSKGIITSKEFSYSKANNEFQEASRPNDNLRSPAQDSRPGVGAASYGCFSHCAVGQLVNRSVSGRIKGCA